MYVRDFIKLLTIKFEVQVFGGREIITFVDITEKGGVVEHNWDMFVFTILLFRQSVAVRLFEFKEI